MLKACLLLGLGASSVSAMTEVIEQTMFEEQYAVSVTGSDDPWWRDRDGEGCWAYRNHLNGPRFACTAPGYEDALYYCSETCGPFADANLLPPTWGGSSTDDLYWRDRDGHSCWAYQNHPRGARFACTARGYEDSQLYCRETCGRYAGLPPQSPGWGVDDLLPRTCRDISNCLLCVNARPLNGDECGWNENAGFGGACTSTRECDYTEVPIEVAAYAAGYAPSAPKPTVSVCVLDTLNCVLPNGGLVERNDDVGTGCTTHRQCGAREYCFSCELCHRQYGKYSQRCGRCDWDAAAAGDCGPRRLCHTSGDSINNFCPAF